MTGQPLVEETVTAQNSMLAVCFLMLEWLEENGILPISTDLI
jgi:hypothetical protein